VATALFRGSSKAKPGQIATDSCRLWPEH